MTDAAPALDLDTVRVVHKAYRQFHNHPGAFECCSAHNVADKVPALLAEVERLRNADRDGYLRGLWNALNWLAAFDQDLPDFDRKTCQQLAAGMRAMVGSAEQRLGGAGRPTPRLDAVKAQRDDLASALAALLHAVESGAGWSETQDALDRADEALKRAHAESGVGNE